MWRQKGEKSSAVDIGETGFFVNRHLWLGWNNRPDKSILEYLSKYFKELSEATDGVLKREGVTRQERVARAII